MSMDLILYTTCLLSFPADLPNPESWKNYGGTDWAYEADSWQVIVDIDKSFAIPEEAKKIRNNLSITIPITLEPIGASKEGYKYLDKTTQYIIKKCRGGVLEGPDGYKKV